MEEDPSDRRLKRSRLITIEVCSALNRTGSAYLVIGGIACILHGHVRATKDVDILIDPTRDNAERILEALSTVGYGFARELAPQEILSRPIFVIGDDPEVDIFTVAWSVRYRDAVGRSSIVVIDDVKVPLISLDDLIATKRTGRLLDAADVEVLEEIKRVRGL
jgi:hypothetical protein